MIDGPVLVTGGTGQVGIELKRRCETVVAPPREVLDLHDPQAIADVVASRPWAAVINAAAYTAVDAAETDVAQAWQLNALAPAVLASEAARRGIPLVQVSTDYVFNGRKQSAYLPSDAPAPLGVYGASKLAGEIAVRSAGGHHAIVRTAWVISPHRANFVKTMLRLGQERDQLRVVSDQRGSPTSAADLADALLLIAGRLAQRSISGGTWHFANTGETTWFDVARAVFEWARNVGLPTPVVDPISTDQYPTAANRPANSLLDTETFARDFGFHPRPWRAALDEIMNELTTTTIPKAARNEA